VRESLRIGLLNGQRIELRDRFVKPALLRQTLRLCNNDMR